MKAARRIGRAAGARARSTISYATQRRVPLGAPAGPIEHGSPLAETTAMQIRVRSFTFRRVPGVVLLLALLNGDAVAQTVYKCTGAGLPVAFQQVPCRSGQRSEAIRLAPVPARAAEPVAAPAPVRPAARTPREPRARPRAAATPVSYECRSAGGAVFYRHGRCPGSIARRPTASPRAAAGLDRVQGTPLPRAEACRRQRNGARDGAEHDETVSTYERNLGRDPCRRH